MPQLGLGQTATKSNFNDHYGASSGWSALARIAREIDEDKIRDCKEDVDTLLVFAGLFSAVMTAFIIESYKSLQQDPTTVTIQILRQIASQSGGTDDGANSTSHVGVQSESPFEPPLYAIRVNVLWFSSLILSLITASIGMLVKQWLREYLGGEYVGPRARLRIRHFRSPGLARWKVFEIVSILPLLLQTSLGLFFIGLCFFTSSIHSSIGSTALPLVIGWSTFVVFTTVLPLFSSRCPYKSPFLKQHMKILRPWCRTFFLQARWYACNVYQYPFRWVTGAAQPIGDVADVLELNRILSEEEEDLTTTSISDVKILEAMDALLLDDDILSGVIMTSLYESQLSGQATTRFLLGVMERRIPANGQSLAIQLPIDLRPLTYRAWRAIMDVIADLMKRKTKQTDKPVMWEPWMGTSILLLFSPYSSREWSEVTHGMFDIFRTTMAQQRTRVCQIMASIHCFGQSDPTKEVIVDNFLQNMTRAMRSLGEYELGFAYLQEIVGRRIFDFAFQPEIFKLSRFLDSHWESCFTSDNMRAIAEAVVSLVQQHLTEASSHRDPWMIDAGSFVVNAMSVLDNHCIGDKYVPSSQTWLARNCCALLTHQQFSQTMISALCQVPPKSFIGGNYIIDVLQALYLHESDVECILDNFRTFLDTNAADEISPIILVFLVARTIRLPEAWAQLQKWRYIFSALAMALERKNGRHPDDSHILAEKCIILVHALECNNADFSRMFFIPQPPNPLELDRDCYFPLDGETSYLEWRDSFDETRSLFPDDFVYALSTIARKETRWYRVRRLKEIGYYVMSP